MASILQRSNAKQHITPQKNSGINGIEWGSGAGLSKDNLISKFTHLRYLCIAVKVKISLLKIEHNIAIKCHGDVIVDL